MKIKRLLQNILLTAMATVVALLIGELAVRLLKPVYDYGDRSLLFSSPTFKLYSGGSVRYYSSEKIREVAVYHDKIEYDVLYTTNNLGFIDTKNYFYESIPGKSYYAFVGDSFTAGVNGGDPWVPRLRNNKIQAEVYNFGVAAAGFKHFYSLLHDMKDKVRITHIVIVAITDDFFRGDWHPIIKDGNVNFCEVESPHSNCQPVPIAGMIPINISESDLLRISKNKYKEIRSKVNEVNASRSFLTKLGSVFYEDSAIFYYTKVLLDTYKRTHQPGSIDYALGYMRAIRSEYPEAEIHLIHLPQKYEVMTNNYYIDIAEQINELGIKYYPALDACNWSLDMFFTRDAHPNKMGYENIAKCVSGYLYR